MTIAIIPIAASIVAGCANDEASRAPLSRDPGPAPAYLDPVKVQAPRRGESPVVDAARQAAGVAAANTIIVCAREDWDKMRARLGKADGAVPDGAQPDCVAEAKDAKAAPAKRRVRPGG
jgi:hypothetical protein